MLRENMVRAIGGLNAGLAASRDHLAVGCNLWRLVEAYEPSPGLAEVSVIIGTSAVPHVAELHFALERGGRFEITCHVDLVDGHRGAFQVVGGAEGLGARRLDVPNDGVTSEFLVVLLWGHGSGLGSFGKV